MNQTVTKPLAKQDFGAIWGLFILSPIIALYYSIRNYRAVWAKNIAWAFIIFYGFTFVIGKENAGGDIVRYVAQFKSLYNEEISVQKFLLLYEEEEGGIDIVRLLLAVGLSRFTDSQAILIASYAFIFGFFFTRNVWFILSNLAGKLKPFTILFFLVFILIDPIWNINGFRFNTAVHIFLFGLIAFFFKKNKWGLLISAMATFVHFSFVFPTITLAVYLLFGNRTHLYFVLFLVTLFVSEIDLELFTTYANEYLPEAFFEKGDAYLTEERVMMYRGHNPATPKAWYAAMYLEALRWTVVAFVILVYFKGRVFLTSNRSRLSLFSFLLLFYAPSNMLNSLPSGGRFLMLVHLIAVLIIIVYIHENYREPILRPAIVIALPFILLFMIVESRISLDSIGITTIIGNPLIVMIADSSIPLIDLFK
jgi:hypothetical protein